MAGAGGVRGRPARHTTAEIVAAACRLADREGVDAVTMRQVAAELGIGAASLYTYVATRDDLLALMLDAVAEHYTLGAATGDWLADVVALAMQTRTILLRHPWAVSLIEARPSTGPRWLDVLEYVLAALADHPADDATKLDAYGAVNAVVVAHVRSELTGHRVAQRTLADLAEAAADGHHPHIAGLHIRSDRSPARRLRRTLAGILTGLLSSGRET